MFAVVTMYQFIKSSLDSIIQNKSIMGKLKSVGISSYLPLIRYAFDTEEVNLGMQDFIFIFNFKLLDFNIKALQLKFLDMFYVTYFI